MIDKEVEEKIKEAARILREDGHALHLAAIRAKLDKQFPDEEETPELDDDGKPKPPPKKDKPEESGVDRKSKHGWWPEGSLDDE